MTVRPPLLIRLGPDIAQVPSLARLDRQVAEDKAADIAAGLQQAKAVLHPGNKTFHAETAGLIGPENLWMRPLFWTSQRPVGALEGDARLRLA
jgi:hypothetical protein